jgi:hypothetical protein
MVAAKVGSGGGWLASVFHAVLALFVPALFIGADIWLGPQFMTAYVDTAGTDSQLLTVVIPWALSFATTGFQYLVMQIIRNVKFKGADKETKFAILVGVLLWIFDTGCDLAGMTSWRMGPEQGIQVIPDNPDLSWTVLAVLTIVVCGGQEYFLGKSLKWQKGEDILSNLPAAKLLEKIVSTADILYGLFRGVMVFFAVGFVLVLNIALSTYYFKVLFEGDGGSFSGGTLVVSFIISTGLTGYMTLLWRQRRRNKSMAGRMDGEAKKKAKRQFMLACILMGIDMYLDVGGFTMLMYGREEGLHMIPTTTSLAWLLLAGVIIGLCGFYENIVELAHSKDLDVFSKMSSSV